MAICRLKTSHKDILVFFLLVIVILQYILVNVSFVDKERKEEKPKQTTTKTKYTENKTQSIPVSTFEILAAKSFLPTLNHINCAPIIIEGKRPRPEQKVTIIGVPTVYRNEHIGSAYLIATLHGLLTGLSTFSNEHVLIQITIGQENTTEAETMIKTLKSEFRMELESGLMNVLVPSPDFYPNLNVENDANFGDSEKRVKWRTKQNLDYIFMWLHSIALKPKYFLQLEDDLDVKKEYFKEITEKVNALENAHDDRRFWQVIDFTRVGFIGKLFKIDALKELSERNEKE